MSHHDLAAVLFVNKTPMIVMKEKDLYRQHRIVRKIVLSPNKSLYRILTKSLDKRIVFLSN